MIGIKTSDRNIVVQMLIKITMTLTLASGIIGTPKSIAGLVQPLKIGSRESKSSPDSNM